MFSRIEDEARSKELMDPTGVLFRRPAVRPLKLSDIFSHVFHAATSVIMKVTAHRRRRPQQ